MSTAEKIEKDLSPSDIKPMVDENGEVPLPVRKAVQCSINAFQRQGFVNLKMLADLGASPIKELAKDPSIFARGYTSRLGYQGFGMYPSLVLKQYVDPETSKYTLSVATAGLEAAIGVPLELNAAKKTLKQSGKEFVSKSDFANTAKLVFLPFVARNYLAWLVLNGDEQDPLKKVAYGGLAGICSAPLDSFGNQVMKVSDLTKGAFDTYAEAFKKMDYKVAAKAVPYRVAGGGIAAGLLSDQFGKVLSNIINPLYQEVVGRFKDGPNSQVEPKKGKKIMEEMLVNER